MKFVLVGLTLFSSFVFAQVDRDIQDIELGNTLISVQNYLGSLFVGQVSGFPEAEIYPGGNLKICGAGFIASETLNEGEHPYDGATSYVSEPLCVNDGISILPFANIISKCTIERVNCGRYCHSIQAQCSVVSAEILK